MATTKINLHEKIGEIVSNHAIIEYALANWLASLISEDYVIGKIITCEMSCKSLTQALQSIFNYRATINKLEEKEWSEIKRLVSMINEAEQERNVVAHSVNVNIFDTNIKYKETSKQKNGFVPKFDILDDEHFEKVVTMQRTIVGEMERLQELTKS